MKNNFSYQRHRRLERKKSDPPVSLLKQLFLKNNKSADTNPIRSDPESHPIRSEIWSDPESDSSFVNGRFFGTFALKSENLANLHGLKVKNGFNLDTNVGAQNLHLLLTKVADFWSWNVTGTVMVELSSLVFLAASIDVIDITQNSIDRWIDQINRVVKVEESSVSILSLSLHISTFYSCLLGILLNLLYSFSFYSFFDLIMTLSERRNVVSFLKF